MQGSLYGIYLSHSTPDPSLSDSLSRSVAIFKPTFSSAALFVPEEAHIILTNPPSLSLSDLKVRIPARPAYRSSL